MVDDGDAAHEFWLSIPSHHDHVELDEFMIMPNHVHGIVVIMHYAGSDVARNVATKDNKDSMSDISPKSGSLAAVIRSYKSAVANRCHTNGYPDFSWQPRYHDHIIRNDKELNLIRDYIRNNPAQWDEDKNHPSGLANWLD